MIQIISQWKTIFALLKRISTIFLFSILLFSQTELHQLLKLPVLLHHFFEHKNDSQNITLSQFIFLHYFNNHPIDGDHEQDMQLPFKTSDCLLAITSNEIPEPIVIAIQPLPVATKSSPKVKSDWNPSSYIVDIFRPPQFS